MNDSTQECAIHLLRGIRYLRKLKELHLSGTFLKCLENDLFTRLTTSILMMDHLQTVFIQGVSPIIKSIKLE